MRHVNVEFELQTSIYCIFAGYVCVCECVRNMAYELPRWMLLAPDPELLPRSARCQLTARAAA